MPHVEIQCFAGRTEDQKRLCAEKVADVIAATLGCEISSVSIAIEDVAEDDWKEKVWDKRIVPEMDYLYKKPGYTYD